MKTIRLPAIRVPTLRSIQQVVLTVGGLGLLSAAAWTLALPAGLAAAGLSCLVLNFLTTPDPAGGRPR